MEHAEDLIIIKKGVISGESRGQNPCLITQPRKLSGTVFKRECNLVVDDN
jgi:hypothetical protein